MAALLPDQGWIPEMSGSGCFTCEHKTKDGYEVKVMFWSGSNPKKYNPYMFIEEIINSWQECYEPKLLASLTAINRFVLDFGLPTKGVTIDDDIGWSQVIYVNVRPISFGNHKKSIDIGVYSEL